MTYLRTSKRPGIARAIYSVLGIFIFLIILSQVIYPHFIPSIFTSIFRPFWVMDFSIGSGSLDSREALLQENEALKLLISEYDVRLDTIKSTEQENNDLRNILGRPNLSASATTSDQGATTSDEHKLLSRKEVGNKILSAVLMKPPVSGYDEYIVDIGGDMGIKNGSLVYAPGNVLIGKVVDVMDDTSKVMLLSSPGEKYEVNIGENYESATAYGRGGGQYETSLPRDVNIKDGDFVRSPQVDDRPLGVVTAVLSDPTEPFVTVLFTSTVNIYNVRWVLIQK